MVLRGGGGTLIEGTEPIVGGANKQILFNDNGIVNGNNNLAFDKSVNLFTLGASSFKDLANGFAFSPGGTLTGYLVNTGWSLINTGTVGWTSSNDPTSGTDTTLARGAAGLVKANGAWGSPVPNTQTGTTYTMANTDSSLIFTNAAAVTLTLLAASGQSGRWLYLKQTGAGAVSSASSNVVPLAGGAAGTAITTAAAKFAILQSDGTNWVIMAAN